ncbi:hypothetical protein pb186bvf_015675 [Paramecium bursaria]
MGVTCSATKEQKTIEIVKLEDHIKRMDPNSQHDQALYLLYTNRNIRTNRLQEDIVKGFGMQFQRTADNSQKSPQ